MTSCKSKIRMHRVAGTSSACKRVMSRCLQKNFSCNACNPCVTSLQNPHPIDNPVLKKLHSVPRHVGPESAAKMSVGHRAAGPLVWQHRRNLRPFQRKVNSMDVVGTFATTCILVIITLLCASIMTQRCRKSYAAATLQSHVPAGAATRRSRASPAILRSCGPCWLQFLQSIQLIRHTF